MRNTLLAVVLGVLVGGCVASVGTSRPPPSGPPPSGPPPAAPPERHPDRHDRDREPRVIQGTVRDAETGQPIDRASVDITSPAFRGEMTVQTGPDGRFRTEEIPRGEFGIRARREGYEAFQRKAVMSDGTAHIDFELQRKRR
jgi:Carboxypeptidase regulatory-like domain